MIVVKLNIVQLCTIIVTEWRIPKKKVFTMSYSTREKEVEIFEKKKVFPQTLETAYASSHNVLFYICEIRLRFVLWHIFLCNFLLFLSYHQWVEKIFKWATCKLWMLCCPLVIRCLLHRKQDHIISLYFRERQWNMQIITN